MMNAYVSEICECTTTRIGRLHYSTFLSLLCFLGYDFIADESGIHLDLFQAFYALCKRWPLARIRVPAFLYQFFHSRWVGNVEGWTLHVFSSKSGDGFWQLVF